MVHHSPLTDSGDLLHTITPDRTHKLGRSDVRFPLSTPRHRAPSMTETSLEILGSSTMIAQKLSLRVKAQDYAQDEELSETPEEGDVNEHHSGKKDLCGRPGKTLEDLPLEIQGLILDYLFGDIHSVTSTSISVQPGAKRISSAMRHPRRKVLADLALVSPAWRDLVQERIYRHSKVLAKATEDHS
jgi:hypothetical protein